MVPSTLDIPPSTLDQKGDSPATNENFLCYNLFSSFIDAGFVSRCRENTETF